MRLLDLCLIGAHARAGEPPVRLGVPLLDEYLRFLAGRCRPNLRRGRYKIATGRPGIRRLAAAFTDLGTAI